MKSSLRKFLSLFFEEEETPPRHSKPIEILFLFIYSFIGAAFSYYLDRWFHNEKTYLDQYFWVLPAIVLIDYLTSKKNKK